MTCNNRIKTNPVKTFLKTFFVDAWEKVLLLWNCTYKYDQKKFFLDHLENNTIEFARFLGDCTCENRWYSSYSNANKKR